MFEIVDSTAKHDKGHWRWRRGSNTVQHMVSNDVKESAYLVNTDAEADRALKNASNW